MSYAEFCSLLSGIMYDTPLGQVVSIRAEKDSKVIKNFTNEQKRIRAEWSARKLSGGNGKRSAGMEVLLNMQQALKEAYEKK